MQAESIGNRQIKFSGLEETKTQPAEVVIQLETIEKENNRLGKGIQLDNTIIPLIVKAFQPKIEKPTVFASMDLIYRDGEPVWQGRLFNSKEERDDGLWGSDQKEGTLLNVMGWIQSKVDLHETLDLIVYPIEED